MHAKSEDRNRRPLHRLHTARYRRQAHDALRRHRRKIALLDLWASWCRSCRLRSRNTIPIYEKYRSRGFVVVGVAREFKNDRAWRTALEHDAYPWLNLLEMDDSTKLWEQYGLSSAAGQTYLIDRDGTILAINPMADELERLLREKL